MMEFRTANGYSVLAITTAQMREVDRLAVEVFHLSLLQMMENAGRGLAQNALEMLGSSRGEVTVLAGGGGNGGGVLCCARHLHNHGFTVHIALDRPASRLTGAVQTQLQTLLASDLAPLEGVQIESALKASHIVLDGLIGYGLKDAPRGRTAELITLCNLHAKLVLANDIPSGIDSTSGEAPGAFIRADRILTLAAPKIGLRAFTQSLYLADIGIPPELYDHLGFAFVSPFNGHYWVRLVEAVQTAS